MKVACSSVDRIVPGAMQMLSKWFNRSSPQTNGTNETVSGHLPVELGDEGKGVPSSPLCTWCRASNPGLGDQLAELNLKDWKTGCMGCWLCILPREEAEICLLSSGSL